MKQQNTWGLLFDKDDKERIIDDDGVVMTCRHYYTLPWDPRATDGSTWPEGGAMLIRLGKYDYLLAGSGVVIDFKTRTEKQQERLRVGLEWAALFRGERIVCTPRCDGENDAEELSSHLSPLTSHL